MMKFLENLGEICLFYLNMAGRMTIFLGQCLWASVKPPYAWRSILGQLNFIGARSLFVIIFTGLFTGMVLGLQGYHLLSKYGSVSALGAGVGNGLVRELGPVLTALMIIGRAGSSMCAEIGIMRNSEQIDALECMAIDPIKYLLAPKYVACVISTFLLSFVFDVVGIFGGYIVAVTLSDVSQGSYFEGMYDSVVFADIKMGMFKALAFGLLTVWVSTSKGYYVHKERLGGFGAEGVSRATTNAVVLASVGVLVWDYLISALMI
ncbi:ABC transporter permease [bacterium]|nr:MAG: ABC transporter permease [bacterium]